MAPAFRRFDLIKSIEWDVPADVNVVAPHRVSADAGREDVGKFQQSLIYPAALMLERAAAAGINPAQSRASHRVLVAEPCPGCRAA